MREVLARLLDWLRRDRLDAELAEELRFHQAQLERDALTAGTQADEARQIAQRQLGNRTAVREDARERWSLPWLDHLQQDIRYALRGLRRSPGFTAAAVITLGLGIGANAAMFNVVDQLMFKPFPYLRQPATVHRVYLRVPGARRLLTRESMPYTRYLDLKSSTTSFSQYAAFFPTTVAIGEGDDTREQPIVAVTASFFDLFDVRPALGRFFTDAEDTTPVGATVAVLSFEFWRSHFGQRDVIGRSIRVDDILCRIIGVAPQGFIGVADASAPVMFLPLTTYGGHQSGGSSIDYWLNYRWDWVEMLVRRHPSVAIEQANADLTQAYIKSREAAREIHTWMPRADVRSPVAIAGAVKTAAGPYATLEARTLLWVTGVAVIVFLIALANVANLLIVRALRRRREMALRAALGVTRRRLVSQSMTESFVLALAGAAAGLTLAQWGGAGLRRLLLPPGSAVALVADWRTLGIVSGLVIAAAIVTGVMPVLLASPNRLAGAREGSYQRSGLRSSLLIAQGALSVVLLTGAGLFVRSLTHLRDVPLGYDTRSVLRVQWYTRGERMSIAERVSHQRRLLAVVQSMPEVERAAWVSNVPLQGTSTMALFVPGIDSAAGLGRFTYQVAGVDYFAAMGTRILRGRAFAAADREGAPIVTVVSASMARVLWPGQDALGQCIRVNADTMPCITVVGVAEDAMHDPVQDQPLRYYLALDQFASEGASQLVLRTRVSPEQIAERVRRTLQNAMPGQQYVTAAPMITLLDGKQRSWRLGATMFGAFGVLALLVAIVGMYGVVAYSVTQRMHELGVRFALGARPREAVRLVIGQGARVALLGTAIGSALVLLAARWIQPLLFEQSATDPVVLGCVAVVLLAAALIASALPAMRATSADPMTVLRAD